MTTNDSATIRRRLRAWTSSSLAGAHRTSSSSRSLASWLRCSNTNGGFAPRRSRARSSRGRKRYACTRSLRSRSSRSARGATERRSAPTTWLQAARAPASTTSRSSRRSSAASQRSASSIRASRAGASKRFAGSRWQRSKSTSRRCMRRSPIERSTSMRPSIGASSTAQPCSRTNDSSGTADRRKDGHDSSLFDRGDASKAARSTRSRTPSNTRLATRS